MGTPVAAVVTSAGLVLRVGQIVVLLPLHATVLEPDLDLTFRQAQRVRDFDATPPRQVAVEVDSFSRSRIWWRVLAVRCRFGSIPGWKPPLAEKKA